MSGEEKFEQDAETLAQAVIDRMTDRERAELTHEAQIKGVSETSLVYRAIVVLMERAVAG